MQNRFKWKRKGLIFKPTDYPQYSWMNEYAQGPASLVYDDFVRVFFSTRPPRDENGMFTSQTSFLDLDRKDLTKILRVSDHPILPLGKKGCFDEFGVYPFSPVRVNATTIYGYYGGWTRATSVPFKTNIGFAKSTDNGENFHRSGDGPVVGLSLYEATLVGCPRVRKYGDTFYLFYPSNQEWLDVDGSLEMTLKIRLATSKDGLHWDKENKNLLENILGENESQASADVTYSNGKYHLFFDYWDASTFRKTLKRNIGYATSTDLINWTRNDAKAGMKISTNPDDFDNEMQAYPHILQLDGKTHMFYLGNSVGRDGFGLMELEGELK